MSNQVKHHYIILVKSRLAFQRQDHLIGHIGFGLLIGSSQILLGDLHT